MVVGIRDFFAMEKKEVVLQNKNGLLKPIPHSICNLESFSKVRSLDHHKG